MQELATRLEALCQVRGVEKFSAEEMVELLEDGEEIDWILDQVLPAAPAEARSELSQLLAEIASAVAPPPVAEEEVSEEEDPKQRPAAVWLERLLDWLRNGKSKAGRPV